MDLSVSIIGTLVGVALFGALLLWLPRSGVTTLQRARAFLLGIGVAYAAVGIALYLLAGQPDNVLSHNDSLALLPSNLPLPVIERLERANLEAIQHSQVLRGVATTSLLLLLPLALFLRQHLPQLARWVPSKVVHGQPA